MPETPPRQSGSEPRAGAGGDRTRLLYAGGALAAFAVLTAVVLVATGGGEEAPDADPAPADCIEKWNGESSALSDGRHASSFHGYSRTQVAYLSRDGETVTPTAADGTACAVIFASNGLDSEPPFAVRVLRDDLWAGASTTVDTQRLAELQAGAFNGANATLQQSGELADGYEPG